MIQEFIYREVTTSYSDVDLVLVHSHSHPLSAELIHAFGLAHEHDLKLGAFGVVIDEFCQSLVNNIILDWDVDCYPLFQLNDVVLEGFYLNFSVFQLTEQF